MRDEGDLKAAWTGSPMLQDALQAIARLSVYVANSVLPCCSPDVLCHFIPRSRWEAGLTLEGFGARLETGAGASRLVTGL